MEPNGPTAHTLPLYDRIAATYASHRRPDPRIARQIDSATSRCRSLLNVGAGTGSYEPAGKVTFALEPSLEMIKRRLNRRPLAVQGSAERLPFHDRAFGGALSILSVHHWTELASGLSEMRRVSRERIVILTWDPERPESYLSAKVRAAISTFSKVRSSAGLARLRDDLRDGRWHSANRDLMGMSELDVGYRLIVAERS
jgi:SAM-dependent methyltransferase